MGDDLNVRHQLMDVFAEVLDLEIDGEDFTDEVRVVDDIGADAADMMELLLQVETVFNLRIDDAQCDALKTVGDFMQLVRK